MGGGHRPSFDTHWLLGSSKREKTFQAQVVFLVPCGQVRSRLYREDI